MSGVVLLPRVLAVRGPDAQTGELSLALEIPPQLAYFEGHFPAHPILPGVVQIHWAGYFGRSHFELPAACGELVGFKFQSVIHPGQRLDLELQHRAPEAGLAFRYRDARRVYASGRLRYRHD